MKNITLLNGPNLNLLGKREPGIYGAVTLEELEKRICTIGASLGAEIACFQSNHEGELIDKLHEANEAGEDGIIFNPGAFTHYSYAIRDAIAGIQVPVIEVHISNIAAREDFRKHSYLSAKCAGTIFGFGMKGYELAVSSLVDG